MIRKTTNPRPDWKQRVESRGLVWYDALPERGATPVRYWDESVYYTITMREVDALEAATNELHQMCLRAAQHVIEGRLYDQFHIPTVAIPLIEQSWAAEPPSLYGRFDLSLGRDCEVKMLEYNADTPTALLEAAVIQWDWFEETKLGTDQFNSIHDKLVDTWKHFSDWIPGGRIGFTSVDSVEDGFTIAYLQETAAQAGYATESFPIGELGWNGREFVSGNSTEEVRCLFKLYPWEWLVREEFSKHLAASKLVWIEPAWKMLLSDKAILPVLWKLHPDHPYLLETQFAEPLIKDGWVKKPILGREGYNVTVYDRRFATGGEYGEEGFVYQRDAAIAPQAGRYAVVGSWIIGQKSAGIGVRESNTPVTDNLSRFVPHVIVEQ